MTTAEILAAIPKLSALVVGDICLDRWCTYDPSTAEPSRETGIPRIGVTHVEVTPGAGGTVANNLAELGARRVAVLGAIGDDGFGYELESALAARGIDASLLVKAGGIRTFTYTKVINGESGVEDCPRLDFINVLPLPAGVEGTILDRLQSAAEAFDVILVSDQAETSRGGVVTGAVRGLLADLAQAYRERTFFADSRSRIELFRNVIAKANADEAAAARARLAPADLFETVQGPLLIVTHGPSGVALRDARGETWVAANAVEHPVDICGAGDSFSAGTALALAAGAAPVEAARFGNRIAAITIMKRGTGTASPEEVLAHPGD